MTCMWYGDEKFTRKLVLEGLKAELERRQRRNPHYSIRAFARDLDVNYTVLSRVLNGERQVSWQMATTVRDKIGLSPVKGN